MYAQLINSIAERAKANQVINDCDFYDDEGCLVCGVCGKRKETIVEFLGRIKKVNCVCKCWQDEQERIKAENEKFLLERKIKKYRSLGFPEAAMATWNFDADDLKTPKLTAAMKRYAENFPEMKRKKKGLLLHGDTGTGKTFYAACVANYLIDRGIPVLMTNFIRLSNEINKDFENRQRYIDSLNDFELLIIDDLGAERQSGFMGEQVYNIIDARYRIGLPLIITTNIPFKEIGTEQDIKYKRIYDRLTEMCFPIEVKGESRRKESLRSDYNEFKSFLGL